MQFEFQCVTCCLFSGNTAATVVYASCYFPPKIKIQSLNPYLSADGKSREVLICTKHLWSFTASLSKCKQPKKTIKRLRTARSVHSKSPEDLILIIKEKDFIYTLDVQST